MAPSAEELRRPDDLPPISDPIDYAPANPEPISCEHPHSQPGLRQRPCGTDSLEAGRRLRVGEERPAPLGRAERAFIIALARREARVQAGGLDAEHGRWPPIDMRARPPDRYARNKDRWSGRIMDLAAGEYHDEDE